MKDGYRVKICGTTNMDDAFAAAREGADYIGAVIEVGFSKRSLTIGEAEELFSAPPVPAVALVFNMPEARLHYLIDKLKPFAVQFLNQEDVGLITRLREADPKVELWQSIHLPSAGNDTDIGMIKKSVDDYIGAGVDLLLFDTVATLEGKQKFGGTGLTSDWKVVKELMRYVGVRVPVLLAGGINPENVEEAVNSIDPYGIDLCSGVEAYPGKKDPDKIKALMKNVRRKQG